MIVELYICLPKDSPIPEKVVLQEKEKHVETHIIRRTNDKGRKINSSPLTHTIPSISELLVEILNSEEQVVQLSSVVHCHSLV